LAEQKGLHGLFNFGEFIPGAAIAHVRKVAPRPFANLVRLAAVVPAVDAMALIEILSEPGILADLLLTLLSAGKVAAPAHTGHVVMSAIGRILTNLRTLRLCHDPPLLRPHEFSPTATGDNGNGTDTRASSTANARQGETAGDTSNFAIAYDGEAIALLRHLHALTDLNINHAYFQIDDSAWHSLLRGLPALKSLAVAFDFGFAPARAFVSTGQLCRKLERLKFPQWPCRIDAELNRVREEEDVGACASEEKRCAWMLFPMLRIVFLTAPDGQATQ
jgi:hypothetical protein